MPCSFLPSVREPASARAPDRKRNVPAATSATRCGPIRRVKPGSGSRGMRVRRTGQSRAGARGLPGEWSRVKPTIHQSPAAIRHRRNGSVIGEKREGRRCAFRYCLLPCVSQSWRQRRSFTCTGITRSPLGSDWPPQGIRVKEKGGAPPEPEPAHPAHCRWNRSTRKLVRIPRSSS